MNLFGGIFRRYVVDFIVAFNSSYYANIFVDYFYSGLFKTDREEYISLAGHLSTKSCDKVWELSRSLVPVVEVTKLSSSKLKIWETSKPSCDNIGLYFFPNKMRYLALSLHCVAILVLSFLHEIS